MAKEQYPKILSERGTNKRLADDFRVSQNTVSLALRGRQQTILSQRIREAAKSRYGALEVPTPQKNSSK